MWGETIENTTEVRLENLQVGIQYPFAMQCLRSRRIQGKGGKCRRLIVEPGYFLQLSAF